MNTEITCMSCGAALSEGDPLGCRKHTNHRADRLVVTQYRDPITSEARTVTTCPEHTTRLLRVLRSEGIGCSSTYSPSFDCDPCENVRECRRALRARS